MHNNLKGFRKEAKLSLQGLADLCGLSKAHLWALEKGRNTPGIETAYILAKVFDVSVYTLFPDSTRVVEETVTVRRVVWDEK